MKVYLKYGIWVKSHKNNALSEYLLFVSVQFYKIIFEGSGKLKGGLHKLIVHYAAFGMT